MAQFSVKIMRLTGSLLGENQQAVVPIAIVSRHFLCALKIRWRIARVDKKQRTGARFTGHDGTVWDADDHASEMLGR